MVYHYYFNDTAVRRGESYYIEDSIKERLDSHIRRVSLTITENQNSATEQRVAELEETIAEQSHELASIEEIIEQKVKEELAARGNSGVRVRIKEYIVKRGDTLWDISARYCQDPYAWVGIYNANGDKIHDPDKIYPGQRIFIPEVH